MPKFNFIIELYFRTFYSELNLPDPPVPEKPSDILLSMTLDMIPESGFLSLLELGPGTRIIELGPGGPEDWHKYKVEVHFRKLLPFIAGVSVEVKLLVVALVIGVLIVW